jgi:hypothetical protein
LFFTTEEETLRSTETKLSDGLKRCLNPLQT